MPLKCFYCFIVLIKRVSLCHMNPRFGTDTLYNLQGDSLHIICFTSFFKKFIVCLPNFLWKKCL